MDEVVLAERFFKIANQRAAAAGRSFGPGAGSDLRQLAQTGAANVLAVSDPSARDALEKEAEAGIQRLVDLMIEEARKIPGYPADLLGEDSFYPAKLRFCPFRPFC